MTATRSMDRRTCSCGQAMIESAIGLVVFVFIVAAIVSFANLFLGDFEMIKMAREGTGTVALDSTGGDSRGNGSSISRHVHPSQMDYGEEPLSGNYSDPYKYPCEIGESRELERWRGDTVTPLVTVPPTAQTRNFPVDLSLMGSGQLFPNGFTIEENVYMPPLGVPR